MADGTGYIRSSSLEDEAGLIHVCAGIDLVGDDVAFAFESCTDELQTILKKKDISKSARCPPPAKSLRVSFDFDIQNSMELAINVTLL